MKMQQRRRVATRECSKHGRVAGVVEGGPEIDCHSPPQSKAVRSFAVSDLDNQGDAAPETRVLGTRLNLRSTVKPPIGCQQKDLYWPQRNEYSLASRSQNLNRTPLSDAGKVACVCQRTR